MEKGSAVVYPRKWGRSSLGIVVPKNLVRSMKLEPDDELFIIIEKK